MASHQSQALVVLLGASLSLTLILFTACEDLKDTVSERIEETIDGEASPLRELDLPNCSKVLTCCDKLTELGLSDSVIEACNDQFKPAVNFVIDQYQSGRDALEENVEGQEETVDELKVQFQESSEPGCRCFLEGTVAQINSDTIDLLPIDCEIDPSTGALESEMMCSDSTEILLNMVSSD